MVNETMVNGMEQNQRMNKLSFCLTSEKKNSLVRSTLNFVALAETHIKTNGKVFPFQFFMDLFFVLHWLNTMIQQFLNTIDRRQADIHMYMCVCEFGFILMLVSHFIFILFQ